MTRARLAADASAGWRRAIGRSLHGAGCGCCGGRAIRLNPTWLAEDIDHALRTRYASAPALLALLDSAPGADFATRLAALAAAPADLAPADFALVERLLQDIIDILASIAPKPTFSASPAASP